MRTRLRCSQFMFLTLIVGRGVIATAQTCPTESSGFAGGSGTVDDPYQVCSAAHVDNVRYYLDAHFVQTRDIDLADWGNFEPLGRIDENWENSESFTGTFDGRGFVIWTLTIGEQPSGSELLGTGLFRQLGGTIQNVNLRDTSITHRHAPGGATRVVGAVVGHSRGLIKNVHVRGSVSAPDDWAFLGGLVGMCTDCQLERSSFEGEVIGRFGYVGGLCGSVREGNARIQDCFANAVITGTGLSTLAGLVGSTVGFLHVRSSYFCGHFECDEFCFSGLWPYGLVVGSPFQVTVEHSFWTEPRVGVGGFVADFTSGGGEHVYGGRLDEDHLIVFQAEGSSWDFENVWMLTEGLPALRVPSDMDADGVLDGDDVCNASSPDLPVDDLGRPVGDLNGDCDKDLLDFQLFQQGIITTSP